MSTSVFEASNVNKVEARHLKKGDYVAYSVECGDSSLTGGENIERIEEMPPEPTARGRDRLKLVFEEGEHSIMQVRHIIVTATQPIPVVID